MSSAAHLGTTVTGAGAFLLVWAAVPRLRDREDRRRRRSGAVELIIALFVLLGPARPAAMALAAIYVGFTLLHLRDLGAGVRACDCFGQEEQVAPARAAVLTALLGAAALGALAVDAPSLRGAAALDPSSLAWTPTAALVLAVVWRLGFSGLSVLDRVSDTAARMTAGPVPDPPHRSASGQTGVTVERRSFLLRVAVIGSALAAAPVRFLLYPGTALGAVVGPWDCRDGKCLDGYTGFCCEITAGATNTCPTGTFAGGWWMCTDYTGRQLCSDAGVRYYVDCNALPGQPFPGGCRCGNDSCANRKIACNVFRYGQCNTQIEGTTAVVCRMISCENPSTISELHCSAALAVDDATCGHEAPCLEPKALQLAGAGGA